MSRTRTHAAQAVGFAAGQLSRIKTYQRYYSLPDPETLDFVCEGRHWFSCRLSTRLLELSYRFDSKHWDHWAVLHDREECGADVCDECGYCRCADWEDAA